MTLLLKNYLNFMLNPNTKESYNLWVSMKGKENCHVNGNSCSSLAWYLNSYLSIPIYCYTG